MIQRNQRAGIAASSQVSLQMQCHTPFIKLVFKEHSIFKIILIYFSLIYPCLNYVINFRIVIEACGNFVIVVYLQYR